MNLRTRLPAALSQATRHLLSQMNGEGFWEGHLSSSALSTATALSALALARDEADAPRIEAARHWLATTQNADGGWGDTPDSPSNLSTTILVNCGLRIAETFDCGLRIADCGLNNQCGVRSAERGDETTVRGLHEPSQISNPKSEINNPQSEFEDSAFRIPHSAFEDSAIRHPQSSLALARAEAYITARAGQTAPERAAAIQGIYGEDRTFASPILMNCALAGLLPWSEVPPLPFELALFPRALYKVLRLSVVSYALPALIAVGALIHRHHPSPNPLPRALRNLAARPVLGMLAGLQPESGGFLEATPLTSFVTMSLIPLAGPAHPVAARGLDFLRRSARSDGSWPIDSNLATWVTTAAVAALDHAGALPAIDGERTRRWIAARQERRVHPFTGAAPGAFAWTHLSGGVPDADDTAGAILALARLGERDALPAAVNWLLDLQNSDGGWPTFCRGWGKLPFDQSAPDLTAHVLRALMRADRQREQPRVHQALRRGFLYLRATQRADGAWLPLWFGNQSAPRHANPVLGTARVLLAWAEGGGAHPAAERGIRYLLGAQDPGGGWGGAQGIAPTVEETALAVAALAPFIERPGVRETLDAGIESLLARLEDGSWLSPAPIGLYFASLWYSEAMYPVLWTVEALGAAAAALKIGPNPQA